MRDLLLVLAPRRRAWLAGVRYWLAVLGADPHRGDVFTRLYAVYVVALGLGWVVVAASGVLALAAAVGGPLPSAAARAGPAFLVLAAAVALTWDAARAPVRLDHGDLEWLGPSPIPRRALALPALLGLLGRTLAAGGFAGVVLATLLHAPAPWPTGVLLGAWLACARSLGWTVAAARWARRGRPRRGTWLLAPLGLLALTRLQPGLVLGPARALAAALSAGTVRPAAVDLGILLGAVALAAVFAAGSVNQITVHEASGLYADIRALGTRYLPNPTLVREITQRARMSRRRALGRIPAGSRAFEPLRFAWGLVRIPEDAWMLLRLALLFRAALLPAFLPQTTGWSWLFWLLLAYRFPRGRLSYLFLRDAEDPFRRQFWLDEPVRRWLGSSAVPLLAVAGASFALWLGVPAGVAPRAEAALFLAALLLAWWLGEGTAAIRQLDRGDAPLDGHMAAVTAAGLVLFAAAVLHRPTLGLTVPAVLLGAVLGRLRSAPAGAADDPGPAEPVAPP